MNVARAIDLEDTEGLIAADRGALLRAASMAGAQVRAIAAAADEGELDLLRGSDRPRSVIWVTGRGTAETAGTILASTLGAGAAEPIVLASAAPPWVGPLDVLIVAGDDPGDPALVGAAAIGVRRGARVVVVAPYEGPLRDSTAGRVAVLEPRLRVPDEFGLSRYLAAGLAALQTVDPKLRIDLASLADELDAEALRTAPAERCSPTRPRHLPLAFPVASWPWLETMPRRWRWPGMGVRSCCGSQTRLWPLPGFRMRLWRYVPGRRRMRCSMTRKSMGRHRSGCGCWRWRWPASGRWWPLGLPGSMTPIWSRLRMCRSCSTPPWDPGGRYWPFGWRWPPCICDWCEDRSPVELLRGALRTYAWGSRTAIAEFTGRPVPAAHPEAELWFGAHPGDPAWLQTPHGQTSLLEALVADPEGQLGSASRARFGDVLPFLVKVLAADEPLSLQAHPSAEQAVEGYLREERMGIPVSSPVRNYRDTSHKPELLVALQPFEALAGFREAARTTELLRALAVSDLDPFIDLLSEGSDADGLRALFTTWITAPQPDIDVLVPAVLDGAIQYVSSGATEFGAEAKTVLELGERYPGDAGVLAALLLNRISLAPGEAIFLPAGNLHAYVRGFGVEVMANSDNVLRGGLTPKHVDVPELLRVLDFAPTPKARLRPPIRREGLGLVFETPTDEFAATLLVLDGDHLGHEVDASSGHDGPQILLCTEGSATVHGKCGSLTLQRGTAAWVAADDGPIRLTAGQPAKLFRATVGL